MPASVTPRGHKKTPRHGAVYSRGVPVFPLSSFCRGSGKNFGFPHRQAKATALVKEEHTIVTLCDIWCAALSRVPLCLGLDLLKKKIGFCRTPLARCSPRPTHAICALNPLARLGGDAVFLWMAAPPLLRQSCGCSKGLMVKVRFRRIFWTCLFEPPHGISPWQISHQHSSLPMAQLPPHGTSLHGTAPSNGTSPNCHGISRWLMATAHCHLQLTPLLSLVFSNGSVI